MRTTTDEYCVFEDLTEEKAKLIAAAPELLAACKAIGKAFDTRPIGGFVGIEDWIDAVRMAREAIDKAEGAR